MPKYWGKQIFTHGRFPEAGQKNCLLNLKLPASEIVLNNMKLHAS